MNLPAILFRTRSPCTITPRAGGTGTGLQAVSSMNSASVVRIWLAMHPNVVNPRFSPV